MEKDNFFTNEGSNSIFAMEMENCNSQQLPNCIFNPNWDNPMDQSDPFESALTSIVSSPANSNSNLPIPGNESVVLKELIGRLGSICNSREVSNGNNSANTSCYNTPSNSPPKLNLSINGNLPIPRNHQLLAPFPADPGFVERAARLSCFGGKNLDSRKMGIQEETDGVPTVPSCDKKVNRLGMSLTQENENSMEESSLSEQIPGIKGQNGNSSARKRKGIPKGKGKEDPSSALKDDKGLEKEEQEVSIAKRNKSIEGGNANSKEIEQGNGNQKQTKENVKAAEPPKDYIHVRARRGQATDSHSLAERVRREKISERMKFLQDLVPGCNKVTGKAVMLDEIINYVQSLQRQVEFLSMKLATVNPRMDVNMESLLSKDMFQPNSLDASAQPFPYGLQSQHNGIILDGTENPSSMNNLMAFMHHNSNMKPSHIDGFTEATAFWGNDLQSVVQMELGQNELLNFHAGTMGTGQMKVEL